MYVCVYIYIFFLFSSLHAPLLAPGAAPRQRPSGGAAAGGRQVIAIIATNAYDAYAIMPIILRLLCYYCFGSRRVEGSI